MHRSKLAMPIGMSDATIKPSTGFYPANHETKRLDIRLLNESDIEPWTHFMADPLAIKYFHPFKTEDAASNASKWIDKQLKRYAAGTYGLQSLFEKETRNFVGQCGLLTQEVNGRIELEIGYSLIPAFWGNGYALEAARFFRDLAFDLKLSPSVISLIHPENIASQKVAEKNGMERSASSRWHDVDVYVYRINNPNFDL